MKNAPESPISTSLYADKVVLGIGRKGASWLAAMCQAHDIKNRAGTVDIGVRYELPDSVMENINKYITISNPSYRRLIFPRT
jgi:uncharacterized FAD-dependent dehydrogenase